MDIESDIEFLLHRCVCQFAFTLMNQKRFPVKTRTILAALFSRTTRENMNGKHTASFKTVRSLSNWARSHKL
jgi:hypothetical protein